MKEELLFPFRNTGETKRKTDDRVYKLCRFIYILLFMRQCKQRLVYFIRSSGKI